MPGACNIESPGPRLGAPKVDDTIVKLQRVIQGDIGMKCSVADVTLDGFPHSSTVSSQPVSGFCIPHAVFTVSLHAALNFADAVGQ